MYTGQRSLDEQNVIISPVVLLYPKHGYFCFVEIGLSIFLKFRSADIIWVLQALCLYYWVISHEKVGLDVTPKQRHNAWQSWGRLHANLIDYNYNYFEIS